MNFRQVIVQHVFWRGLYFFSVFVLNILISRLFRAEGSGRIYYVVNNLSFLLLVISLSLESGCAYYASKAEINLQKISLFCLVWSILATLLSLAALMGIFPIVYPDAASKPEFVLGCSCYILGVLLTTYFAALFYAKQVFRLPNIILLFVNIILSILMLFFQKTSFFPKHFVLIYFMSFLLQGFLIAAAFFFQFRGWRGFGLPWGVELKRIFHYSLLALAVNIAFFLVYRVDYWFVKAYCSPADLGNYIQVSKLGQVLVIVPSIVASTIFPLVSGGQNEEVQKTLKILTRMLLFGIGMLCILLALIGKWAFPFIFGKSFSEMHALFLLLIPGILALAAHYPLTAYFAGKKMIRVNIRGALFALAVIVTGDLFFIPISGVKAAPLISSLGYAAYYWYVLFVFRKIYPASFFEFFVIKKSDLLLFNKIWQQKK
jgi:O-antigen/teichoic acid export membrane protein